MPEITLATHQESPVLLPDGWILPNEATYRVGMLLEGVAVYAMCKPMSIPLDARFLRFRIAVHGRQDQCAVCRGVLVVGDMITTILTTHRILFPTCFVHTACCDDDYAVVYALHAEWVQAQRYAHWF